jgi:hypothetical protein
MFGVTADTTHQRGNRTRNDGEHEQEDHRLNGGEKCWSRAR